MASNMASTNIIDFNDLCRLCATKTSIVVGLHIFQSEAETREIHKKITSCLPVQVVSTDKLPKMVCQQCILKLEMLFEFREKSVQTETFLLELFRSLEPQLQKSLQNGVESVSVRFPEHIGEIEEHQPLHEKQHEQIQTQLVEEDILQDVQSSIQENPNHMPDDQFEDLLIVATAQHLSDGCETNLVQNRNNSQSVCAPGSRNNNLKCEPDVLIKEEDDINARLRSESESELQSASGSDDNDEDRSDHCPLSNSNMNDSYNSSGGAEDATHQSQYVTVQRNFESRVTPPEQSNCNNVASFDSAASFVNTSINPAANGLLLLSRTQNQNMELKGNPWIFCNMCGKAFDEQIEFQTHYESHCNKCDECGALFTNEDALNVHMEDMHFPSSRKGSGSKGGRKKHWVPKVCKECGKQYRTNYKLMEHMRKHTGEKPFVCSSCPKAFRSKIGLAQHEAKHTGEYEFSCNTCGKGFQCKSYLIVHQRVHSTLKPYACTTCGRNFKTKQALLDHQNRHLGIKPYLCETCGRRFITKGLCKSHQKIHSGQDNKQYPCMVCNKMFVSKSYLATHIRIHSGEKPFICETCGKGFLTRVDLRIHSTMHSGEKSFVCEWCGKAFARRDALRCHRRSHTGERPYRCEICGQTFTQFSPLTIHKRLHTGERPYPCEVCSKAFVSRSTLTAHRKKHHV